MRTSTTEQLTTIDERFAGMPGIAHGGYVAGLMAAALNASSAEVRLRRPITPGRPVALERHGGERAELSDGDVVLAEAKAAELLLQVPRPVSLLDAAAASHGYPGHEHHLFPYCFVCGPERHAGD